MFGNVYVNVSREVIMVFIHTWMGMRGGQKERARGIEKEGGRKGERERKHTEFVYRCQWNPTLARYQQDQ